MLDIYCHLLIKTKEKKLKWETSVRWRIWNYTVPLHSCPCFQTEFGIRKKGENWELVIGQTLFSALLMHCLHALQPYEAGIIIIPTSVEGLKNFKVISTVIQLASCSQNLNPGSDTRVLLSVVITCWNTLYICMFLPYASCSSFEEAKI